MLYHLFVFDSTSSAIAAQKALIELDVIVMPTLREISASCGMALRLRPEFTERARAILVAADISGWRLYRVISENNRNCCKQLI